MSHPEAKRIIRQWDREIEDEVRAEATRHGGKGPWRAVVWGALWLVWLASLVGIASHMRAFGN